MFILPVQELISLNESKYYHKSYHKPCDMHYVWSPSTG